MSTPEGHGSTNNGPNLKKPHGIRVITNEVNLPKNKSTGNLLSHNVRYETSTVRPRLSFDAGQLARSPIVASEHEHGLGASGLRRIRQQPSNRIVSGGHGVAPLGANRATSLNVPLSPAIKSPTGIIPSGTTSPTATFGEDLTRFPSESLHSFSFTHQSEEFIHSRQSVLRRSIDFMQNRLNFAASSPGIANAQAKLSGDQELQSMMELLAKANLIGQEAEQGHGWTAAGPVTGPADLSGENLFEKSFIPRSGSPVQLGGHGKHSDAETSSSTTTKSDTKSVPTSSSSAIDDSISPEDESDAKALSKLTTDDSVQFHKPTPGKPSRVALKRTLTDVTPLHLQSHLNNALARPYIVGDSNRGSELLSSTSTNPTAQAFHLSTAVSPVHHLTGTHSAAPAPHGHGSRWAPAAQAIFTTETQAPWTITAANDLACLVFGVTRAEVRKLGILEVVRDERRKWLEDRLNHPDGGIGRSSEPSSKSQRNSPATPTTSLAVGSGVTAKLLSKPSSREAAKRRAQTEDGSGSSYSSKKNVKGGLNHTSKGSRGVLLCGDVVPIQKRNGTFGSASLWVKEKRGGLIWVLEEIAEDVVFISVDEVGCIMKGQGASEAIWGTDRLRRGMDLKRLIPSIPRLANTNTGALDYDKIAELRSFTARTSNSISVPITVEQLSGEQSFRVSSFPHIAGIIVLAAKDLVITSANTVFSSALFGQGMPNGLHINDLVPTFDKLLHIMTDEDKIELVDGIVIPEHSFRRARALLAMREGRADAAAVFLRPSGLPARHRDGADIMVDVQMRVVRSEKSPQAPPSDSLAGQIHRQPEPELVYALWVTYSRHLHATNHGVGPVTPASRPATPPHQPSPGQPVTLVGLEDIDGSDNLKADTTPTSLLTQQLRQAKMPTFQRTITPQPTPEPILEMLSKDPPKKKTISDFVVLEDMGQGAYGQVKLCRYKKNSNKKAVIKYVTKRRILVDTWTRDRRLGTVPLEIHVLDYLRRDGFKHPNIVEMADFFEDDINYYIEMVPHGLPGMDLFDYIELRVNMDEVECRNIFVQVAEAVHHLHTKAKVVHRDIKDENVILDGEGNIKLIDFGSAAYIKHGPFDVFVGTIDYAAPEVLAGKSYRGKEQDVWALGILLYTIVFKENPFYSIDEIMDHDLRVPYIMSEESIDLIRLMLNRDVDQRITISQVLEHPWCTIRS